MKERKEWGERIGVRISYGNSLKSMLFLGLFISSWSVVVVG